MGVEGVVLLVALEGVYMRRLSPPYRAKDNFDLDGGGLVSVIAVSVASAAACLSFESVSAVPLLSSPSSEQKS